MEVERDYLNLKHRYTRLQVSDYFSKVVATWASSVPFESRFALTTAPPIYPEFEAPQTKEEKKVISFLFFLSVFRKTFLETCSPQRGNCIM